MHTLICGVTESGKTTLARSLAREFLRADQNVIVYDPMLATNTGGGGWAPGGINPDHPLGRWPVVVFNKPDQFWNYIARADVKNAHVFIDEAGEQFGLDRRENHWLLTRGRHKGLAIFLIAQRPRMIAPTVRYQCSRAYVFRLAENDMRAVGADFGFELDADLDKGDYLCLNSGSAKFTRANIFEQLNPKERK